MRSELPLGPGRLVQVLYPTCYVDLRGGSKLQKALMGLGGSKLKLVAEKASIAGLSSYRIQDKIQRITYWQQGMVDQREALPQDVCSKNLCKFMETQKL